MKKTQAATTTSTEGKKRKSRSTSKSQKSVSKKQKKDTANGVIDEDSSNSVESEEDEDEDEDDEDMESLLMKDIGILEAPSESSSLPPPSTNGTSSSKGGTTNYIVPVKSMMEEDPSLNWRRVDFKKKEPELRNREIRDIHEYNSVKEEYRNKYETYIQLDKKLQENKALFKNLTDQYLKCGEGPEKKQIGDILKQLFTIRQDEVKKFTNAFKILHEELAHLKKLVANFVSNNTKKL